MTEGVPETDGRGSVQGGYSAGSELWTIFATNPVEVAMSVRAAAKGDVEKTACLRRVA